MSNRTSYSTIRLAIASTAAVLAIGAAAETAVIAATPVRSPAMHTEILANNPWPVAPPAGSGASRS